MVQNEFTEIQRKWIDALRSGDYQQCKNYLHTNDGYCCLGVACDILKIPVEYDDDGVAYYQDEHEKLPASVYRQLNLIDNIGAIRAYTPHFEKPFTEEALSALNDNGYTFEKIADFMEKYPFLFFDNFDYTVQ